MITVPSLEDRRRTAREIRELVQEARRLTVLGHQVSEAEKDAFLRRKVALLHRLDAESMYLNGRGGET